MQQLLNTWTYNDVEGATKFVLTLNAGSEQKRAVCPLVQHLQEEETKEALLL
jgi:hypothetical protein